MTVTVTCTPPDGSTVAPGDTLVFGFNESIGGLTFTVIRIWLGTSSGTLMYDNTAGGWQTGFSGSESVLANPSGSLDLANTGGWSTGPFDVTVNAFADFDGSGDRLFSFNPGGSSGYVAGTVSDAELAALSSDYPMLIGNNILERYDVAPIWATDNETWSTPATDRSDANAPTRRLFDRAAVAPSEPTFETGHGQWGVLFNLDASTLTDGLHSFDTVTILNHNLASLGNPVTLFLTIADDTNFTSNAVEILGGGLGLPVTSNERILVTNLAGVNGRYAGVKYIWLSILADTGTIDIAPYIGEIILGRRRQLAHFPDVPWEDRGSSSETVDHHAWSGTVTRYVKHSGRRDMDWTLRSGGSAEVVDQENEVRSWWRECQFGTQPSVVVLHPQSSPTPLYMLPEQAELQMPVYGPYERAFKMRLREQPLFWQTEQASLDSYPV